MTMKSSGAGSDAPANGAAPPAYSPVAGAPPPTGPPQQLSEKDLKELNAAFSALSIPDHVTKLDESTCLAHLKLLSAFHNLKEDIGYTDGLYNIFDTRASKDVDAGADPAATLAKLREKRWAVYVARAVDRYEAWWNTLTSDPLTIADMDPKSPKYGEFVNSNTILNWTPQMLPPLGTCYIEKRPCSTLTS